MTLLFGMMTMLFDSIRIRVVLQVMSSTYPSWPDSSRMKSPIRIGFSMRTWIPAKRFASVSWRASAAARPPMPKAVMIGVMEIPRMERITRNPTVRIDPLISPCARPVPGIGRFDRRM